MSESTASGGSDQQVTSGETEIKDQKQSVAYESHQKLLSEKKKMAERLAEMESKLKSIDEEKLEAQGKLKELNDNLKKQLSEKDQKLKSVFNEFAQKTVKSKFEAEAVKLGCIKPDALYKLVDMSGVEITDDFGLNEEQLKSMMAEAQKEHSYLFKKEVGSVKDSTPNPNKPDANIGLKGKSIDELAMMLASKN